MEFRKSAHVRYWQRCLRSALPHHYTANDSNRMALGFFILAAVDLLSTHPTASAISKIDSATLQLSSDEKRAFRSWILQCQHPNGGFCGGPTHVFPNRREDGHCASGDANIAATSFALLILAILGTGTDDSSKSAFDGVQRRKTLLWLRSLQRPDGSFGEITSPSLTVSSHDGSGKGPQSAPGEPQGGCDMRYCYLAATIRWMLRGDTASLSDTNRVDDIDVSALISHIRRAQAQDGGLGEMQGRESHAGYALCGVAALALLDRPAHAGERWKSSSMKQGIKSLNGLRGFMASRMAAYPGTDDEDDAEAEETANHSLPHDVETASTIVEIQDCIGFNGRCNKASDTCYTWWTIGTSAIIAENHPDSSTEASASPMLNETAVTASRRFLLNKAQHLIGGFAKYPGGPPDLYHSYLGLIALAMLDQQSHESLDSSRSPDSRTDVKAVDPTLCVSMDVVRTIEVARDALLGRESAYTVEPKQSESSIDPKDKSMERRLLDLAVRSMGHRPAWLEEAGL